MTKQKEGKPKKGEAYFFNDNVSFKPKHTKSKKKLKEVTGNTGGFKNIKFKIVKGSGQIAKCPLCQGNYIVNL